MKLTKTIKRILALGTGATMVGATLLSASAAADLGNYPAPFVKDGKFNAILVVGDQAASSDVIGSVDVATSVQFASRTKKTVTSSGGASVSAVGDAWKVGTSTKKLEMSEYLDAGTASTHQEEFRNISTFIGEDELGVLADGTFSNDKGDYKYQQFLYFDELNTPGSRVARSVIFDEDPDTDVTADYVYIPNGAQVGRYSLEFTASAESDITDSAGSASTTGTYLWNFEGKSVKMLGVDYSIVKARRTSSVGNGVELTLMGGAARDILQEGETKTYTVGGKDYEVKLAFVSSTNAKFVINGEATDSLSEGSTDTLADKTQVGVRDILYQDFAGGVHQAEFYLGAEKIVLKDTIVSDAGSSDKLEVGNEKIDESPVVITGTDDNTTFKIDTIQWNVTADDDIYIPAGGKLSALMDEPQSLLGAWDVAYAGLAPVTTEKIALQRSGSNQYNLQFTDGSGNKVSVPVLYTSGTTVVKVGDNNDNLVLHENLNVSRNDYFILTDSTQKAGDRRTYAFRYKGASKSTDSAPVIRFQNIGSGETIERTYGPQVGVPGTGSADANIKIGGATYNIWNSTLDTNSDFDIRVDMNGDGTLGGAAVANVNEVNITTNAGAQIILAGYGGLLLNETLGDVAGGLLSVTVETVDSDDYDSLKPTSIAFNATAASGQVGLAEATTITNLHYISPDGESNTNYVYTNLGAKVKWDNPTNDPDTVDIDYPKGQRLPQVFFTTPGVEIKEGETAAEGQIVYYDTTPIEVGAAKLASEVTNVRAQNTILVGGPCANTAAAEVLGNPADCAAGFEEGKALLKLVEHTNGNVALLVAGYSAMDTRRAARVLANYATWKEAGKLKGTEVEVAGTSFTDITVSAPAPKMVAPAPSEGNETTEEMTE